ncbi:MAG: slipin family protein, partial [Gammaproteobacteria bacterium]|nr:slipin family protein [Gammaproteobacteria bacterium]
MFGIKRVVVARHERGLLIKNRNVQEVVQPGNYWVFGPRTRIETYEITVPEFEHELTAFIVKDRQHPARRYFDVVEIGDRQVGLVYKDNKLADVLSPGSRRLYWKGIVDVRVEIIDIDEDYTVPKPVVALLARQRPGVFPAQVKDFICVAEVADKFVGMLIVDGELVKTLQPGLHAYWKFNRRIGVEQIDLRLQSMEVSGQEMLTKDKVSLRVNLSATYQVADPVKARSTFHNFVEQLYRELQFAVRQAIAARTLDALLGNKDELDRSVCATVRAKVGAHGLEVHGVGIKDVILPGDMKTILNQVVEAEKVAQANVIKRREETAATRSALNTARLMDENPTLFRLKELEVLEKVTEKVDRLTVFGG